MALTLEVETDHEAGFHVMSVLGEVDLATIDQLGAAIDALAPKEFGLILDLTSTEFMDSSGLRLLLATKEGMASNGQAFKLAVSGGPIARLLDVTGLLPHLDVHGSVEEAAAH
ncbi:MAG: STAS domain-containing protein [Acidimicrobiia bacterium]